MGKHAGLPTPAVGNVLPPDTICDSYTITSSMIPATVLTNVPWCDLGTRTSVNRLFWPQAPKQFLVTSGTEIEITHPATAP